MKKWYLLLLMLAACFGVQALNLSELKTMYVIGSDENPGIAFADYQKKAKKDCDVNFAIPAGFKEHKVSVVLMYSAQGNHGAEGRGNACETAMLSDDGNCLIGVRMLYGEKQLMYVDAKKMIAEEVAGYNGVTDGAKLKGMDMGKWVTELSATASKMVANADKAYLVDFPDIVPSDKCDWKHCQQLVFEKKDCPTYYVTVLYTDKGYEQAQKYLPAAFGVFRYGKQAGAPEFIK